MSNYNNDIAKARQALEEYGQRLEEQKPLLAKLGEATRTRDLSAAKEALAALKKITKR